MLRVYLVLIIAVLAAIMVLAMLRRFFRLQKQGAIILGWRHVIAASAGLIAFVGAALFLVVDNAGTPDASYQPPRIENGKILPGEFHANTQNIDSQDSGQPASETTISDY